MGIKCLRGRVCNQNEHWNLTFRGHGNISVNGLTYISTKHKSKYHTTGSLGHIGILDFHIFNRSLLKTVRTSLSSSTTVYLKHQNGKKCSSRYKGIFTSVRLFTQILQLYCLLANLMWNVINENVKLYLTDPFCHWVKVGLLSYSLKLISRCKRTTFC